MPGAAMTVASPGSDLGAKPEPNPPLSSVAGQDLEGLSAIETLATPDAGGNFEGSRVADHLDARFRFTGAYTGDDQGFFAFNIDVGGNVTGTAFSVTDGSLADNGALDASTSDGIHISADLDTDAGAIGNFAWNDNGDGGTFTGDGCKLN